MSKKLFSLPILVALLVSLALSTVAAAPPPQEGVKTYTIQKDDWLSKLAEKEYGDPLAYTAIYYYNNLKAEDDGSLTLIEDPNLIEVGWTIYIPSSEEASAYLASEGSDDAQDDAIGNSNEGDVDNSNVDDGGNFNADDDDNSNSDDDDDNSNSDDDDDNSNSDDDDDNSNSDDDSNSNSDDDHDNSNSDDDHDDDNSNSDDDDDNSNSDDDDDNSNSDDDD
jgi:hypothetical protein